MSNEKDKKLDDLFKRKLEDPIDEIGYREGDWDALEQMLDKKQKRRGIIYLLPILSSVAALLLLFLGWWILRPQVNQHNGQNNLQAINRHQQTGTNSEGLKHPSAGNNQLDSTQKTAPVANYADNYKAGKSSRNNSGSNGGKSFFTLPGGSTRHNSATHQTGASNTANTADSNANEALLAVNPVPVFEPEQIAAQSVSPVDLQKNNLNTARAVFRGGKIKMKTSSAFRPQYAVSVLAAPDVNGVGSSFQQGKVGTNVGLMFSGNVTKKLTISTGALYSAKPYATAFNNYHTSYQFSSDPENVLADCRMIDIPINVGYQLYNKHQNKISVGTGLSSYIMLHERYTFNYADPSTASSSFVVPNSSNYFFGVLNLNATYDHQINSKVGIEIQPYVKLPLTNIGYSQVRLQTTGVAVGLRWNLNSLTKP
jgi:hypothetical protein